MSYYCINHKNNGKTTLKHLNWMDPHAVFHPYLLGGCPITPATSLKHHINFELLLQHTISLGTKNLCEVLCHSVRLRYVRVKLSPPPPSPSPSLFFFLSLPLFQIDKKFYRIYQYLLLYVNYAVCLTFFNAIWTLIR